MIDAWLKEEQFSAEEYNAVELLHAFQQEMQAGLAGERSSLPMLPSYINPLNRLNRRPLPLSMQGEPIYV